MAVLINNVAYSWAMIELTAPGLTGDVNAASTILQGVSEIKWNTERKVDVNYGLGGKPVNRGFGNTRYEASIVMDYNTQTTLRSLGENGRLKSLMELGEFDLIISFANEMGVTNQDWTTETVTLKGCFFNQDGMDAKQDDTNLTKEFNLNPFEIEIGSSAA